MLGVDKLIITYVVPNRDRKIGICTIRLVEVFSGEILTSTTVFAPMEGRNIDVIMKQVANDMMEAYKTGKRIIRNKLEIDYFENNSNKIEWNNKDLTFKINFDQELKNFFKTNFNRNILDEISFNYIKDFDTLNFEGQISEDYLSKFSNLSDIKDIINNFKLSIKNAQIDISNFNFMNEIVKIDGPIDIIYDQDNIHDLNKTLINFNTPGRSSSPL